MLLAHGQAPYKHRDGAAASYFVRYRDDQGREREVWGLDLERAMEALSPQSGDRIALVNAGRVPVDVRESIVDESGVEQGFRVVRSHRNEWVALHAEDLPEPQTAAGGLAGENEGADAISPEEAAQRAAEEAERIEKLRAAGEQIIDDPEAAIATLTAHQSVFTRRELEKHLKANTVDEPQLERARAAVLESAELVGLRGEDSGSARDGRIVGEFLERGFASYLHEDGARQSYFVRLRDDTGEVREVWGADLQTALNVLDPAVNQRIALVHEGKQLIKIHERDARGHLTQKQAYRNSWLAEDAPRQATGNLFTSREIQAIEKRLIEVTDRLADGMAQGVSQTTHDRIVAKLIAEKRGLNPEQAAAFKALISGEQLVNVNGAAGTGKSYVLAQMREAYEAEGFRVMGALLQGKTGQDLERDSGIKTQTIASLLLKLDSGSEKLDAKTVLVVDEAGMVGSKDYERLLSHVEKTGAHVRLVGDAKQLNAVSYGAAFARISARVKPHELIEIQRQKTGGTWMCDASKQLAAHTIGPAIRAYADNGMVQASKTHDEAKLRLVEKWDHDRLTTPEKSQIVVVRTNDERRELNLLMREHMRESGHLGDEAAIQTKHGKLAMAEGERIVFGEREKAMGLFNGTAGTVEKIKGHVLTVRLQDGRAVDVDTQKYTDIDYGYAVTVHKSQGMTVDSAYSLVSPGMAANNAYVAWTRHKEVLQVFYGEDKFRSLDAMINRLSNPERKAFSADHELADSIPEQYLRAAHEQRAQAEDIVLDEFAEIRANLDGDRLLAHLSHSHGTLAEQYSVVKHEKGHDLIQCGSRNFTVSDFLTKQLGLAWREEAVPVLRAAYAAQLADVDLEARHAPREVMFKGFAAWRAADWHLECKGAEREFNASANDRRRAIDDDYKAGVARLKDEYSNHRAKGYRTELSLLRAQRAFRQTELNVAIDRERDALQDKLGMKTGDLYRVYLQRQVERGDDLALAELRRQTLRDVGAASPHPNYTTGERLSEAARVASPMLSSLTYTANRYGDVTYRRDGKDLLVDEAKRVRYIDRSPETIEAGLRLSVQKFGSTLNVRGDDEFKRRVVEVAVDRGLQIQFSSPELAQYAHELQAKRRAELEALATPTPEPRVEQQTTKPGRVAAPAPREGESFEAFQKRLADEARARRALEQETERKQHTTKPDTDFGPELS